MAAVITALLGACGPPPTAVGPPAPSEEAVVTSTPDPRPATTPGDAPGPTPSATGSTSAEEKPLPPRRDAPAIVVARLPGDGFVEPGGDPGYQCVHYFWLSPDGSGLPDGVVVGVSEVVVEPPGLAMLPGACPGTEPPCPGAELTAQSPGCEISLGPGGRVRADSVQVGVRGTVQCAEPTSPACRDVRAQVADGQPAALVVPVLPGGDTGPTPTQAAPAEPAPDPVPAPEVEDPLADSDLDPLSPGQGDG